MLKINDVETLLGRFTYAPGVKFAVRPENHFGLEQIWLTVSEYVHNPDDPDGEINNGLIKVSVTQVVPHCITMQDNAKLFWAWLENLLKKLDSSKRHRWMRLDGHQLFDKEGRCQL